MNMSNSNYKDIRKSISVISTIEQGTNQPRVVYRMAGSDYILLEYGDITLDVNLRVRLHLLRETILTMQIEGVLELTPGLRSILIQYDGLKIELNRLIEILKLIEKTLPIADEVKIPSRTIRLPIAFHDKWTKESVDKYMASIRSEGPYLPDNVEFVAKANDLSSIDEVRDYFLSTEYLVIGLGDVYLGAPCAVPLDPRYRMVVPKYNPARTWTAEGSVGLGGAFLCIYPMESPGGYQLVGRTIPIWNTWQTSKEFKEAPWLLRYFDRIKFEQVSEVELEEIRNKIKLNQYEYDIEEGVFDIRKYN
jgi:urea carboxylase